jgi:hypothetical protein
MTNKVSSSIDQVTLDKIINNLKEARALIPELIVLTPKERMGGVKMGDGSIPFVQKTLEHAIQHPEIVPGFVDVEEFKKDVEYDAALRTIETHLTELADNISDTRLVAGGEAMFAALSVYNYVKQSVKQNISSAKGIYDDLKNRFMFKKHDITNPTV